VTPEELAESREVEVELEPGLQIIPRISLKEKAVRSIREAIERGELQSGQVLTELGLARKLGVGQPTIREALLELEFLGFIERQGPRKTRVTQLTRKAIKDIYQVRFRLETMAAEIVAGQKDPDLRDCWSAVFRMEEAAKLGSINEFYQADIIFHRALWKQAQNESLESCLEQLVPKLMTFSIIQKAYPTAVKLVEIADMHRRLLDVITAGDVAGATNMMEESMRNALYDGDYLANLN
jgi:DNA-binding GntR family transcriptional regulator